jgi:hypothetical protein
MSVLVGTSLFEAPGDGGRRQAAAVASLRALTGVGLVNVQWPDAPYTVAGIRTLPALRLDSVGQAERPGRRQPIVSEMMDVLARAAEEEGRAYFALANADIVLTQQAVDRISQGGLETYVFSRMDVDAAGRDQAVLLQGTDVFAARVSWWRRHRERFRAYILGEPVWDNVYTAIFLCHSDGVLLNRERLVLHEEHSPQKRGPFGDYTQLLAALDRPYFSLWAEFVDELTRLRQRGASAAEEDALRRTLFTPQGARRARLFQAARGLKARLRYAVRAR